MPKSKRGVVGTRARDLMEVPPITVEEGTTVDDVADIMWERNIGSVIVVNGEGLMTGILTERDMVFVVTKALVEREVPVSSIMSKSPLKASPNESMVTCLDRMIKESVRHLPVVDKEGRPLGMISMRDAMGISEPLLKFVFRRQSKARARTG